MALLLLSIDRYEKGKNFMDIIRQPITNTCHVKALRYLSAGLSIIPIKPDGSKSPALTSWKQYQEEKVNIEVLEKWFEKNNGIALVCGAISENLEVIDFDKPGLYEEYEELAKEQGLFSLLSSLPLESTPKGGRHLFYRCESRITGNLKLALEEINGKISTLIETRGEGGCVIVSPSPAACHELNKPYKKIRGSLTSIPVISSKERAAIISLARLFNHYVKPSQIISGIEKKGGALERPGDSFNALANWSSILGHHGWQQVKQIDNMIYWRRPEKKGTGISATTGYAGTDLLYIFSTNAAPFESEKGYTKFAAYALLEHKGNFREAAKTLLLQGYGKQSTRESEITNISELQYTPEPITEIDIQLPDFPIKETIPLRGFIKNFYDYVITITDAPDQFIISAALVLLSSILGRRACIDWFGGSLLYPNLFVLLVGESTLLRKSTVINIAKKLILEIIPYLKLAEQFSWEGLVDEMGYPIDENGKLVLPKDKNSLTPEQKAQKIWLIDEYAAFLQGVNKKAYMADLKLLLTELYGCPPVYLRRLRKESAQITQPYLNILGGTTADVFIKALDPEDLKSGFLQRHLLVLSKERSRFISRPVTGRKEIWKELGKWLIKKSSQVNKMQWSKEADLLFFDKWVTSHENPNKSSMEDMKILGSYYGRLKDYCAKFSMLYELSFSEGSNNIISEEAVKMAIALTEYQKKVVNYFLTEETAGDDLVLQCREKILEILRERRKQGKENTSRREILIVIEKKYRKIEIYEKALKILQDEGLISAQWSENKNRTTTYIYWLNN